ncbi:MAG: hypothetical protein AAGG75_03570 [Bacteroidota bacterium]
MSIKSCSFVFSVLFFATIACSPPPNPGPEAVARQWQAFVDKNQFDEARKLSTPRAQEMVSLMERLFQGEEGDLTSSTLFKSMNCAEKGDSLAICTYQIIDEEELIVDSFTLIKDGSNWLVDIPEEEDIMEEEDVEKLFNEFEEILNKALEEEEGKTIESK